MKIEEIMQKEVISVSENADIKEIAKALTDNKVSGLTVVNAQGDLVGIVSEGDLLHKETNPRMPDYVDILGAIIYYHGMKRYHDDYRKLMATKASDIMTTKMITVSKETTVEEAAQLMVQHSIKRLPVIENGKMIGIISRADIVRTLVD